MKFHCYEFPPSFYEFEKIHLKIGDEFDVISRHCFVEKKYYMAIMHVYQLLLCDIILRLTHRRQMISWLFSVPPLADGLDYQN